MKKIKVVIAQEAIPGYRIPIFQKLANTPLIDLEVVATFPHHSRAKGLSDIEFSGKFKEVRMNLWAIVWRGKRFTIIPYLGLYVLKNRPDVVILPSIFQPVIINFPIWLLLKLSGAKLIRWSCLGYKDPTERSIASPTDRLMMWLKKKMFQWNYADAELAYSEFTAHYLHEHMNIPKERIFIAYNSIDTDELNTVLETCRKMPAILPENNTRIIFVGRLTKSKRVDILLKAFQMVNKKLPDSEILIIGDGPERQRLERMARQFSIEKSGKFLGAIYDNVLKCKYMIASSVFVLPGLGGLAINEAMCFGLPVVCSIGDGTEKQLVYDGVTGYLANYGDANDYAEKIYAILQDEELRLAMSERARAIIQDKVNIRSMISGFQNALRYVTRDKGNRLVT